MDAKQGDYWDVHVPHVEFAYNKTSIPLKRRQEQLQTNAGPDKTTQKPG